MCVGGGGGGQCFSVLCCIQRLHVVTPGQLLLCDSWLKLIADCPTLLGKLVFESRVPFDGITQFSPKVSSYGGFAHLSGW